MSARAASRSAAAIAMASLLLAISCTTTATTTPRARNGDIAFIQNDEIFLVHPDGSGLRPLPLPHGALAETLAWSPDGTELAFCCGPSGIDVIRPDGSGSRTIAEPRSQPIWSLTWSPDGSAIAAQEGGPMLQVFALDGSVRQTMPVSHCCMPTVVWSASGEKMATVSRGLWVSNANGTDRTQVRVPGDPTIIDASWSPDATRLVFSTFDGHHCGIYFADATGGDVHQVERANLPDPRPASELTTQWSPDGSEILLAGRYLMNVDGTTISGPIVNGTATWSPDGTQLLAVRIHHPADLSMAPRVTVSIETTDVTGQHATLVAEPYASDNYTWAAWQPLPR